MMLAAPRPSLAVGIFFSEGVVVRVCRIALTALCVSYPTLHAQDHTVVFEGQPLKKVESSFQLTTSRDLSPDESFEYSVRIVERRGKYYWASRGMKELIRSESGAYITFHAVDGSGYVRTGVPFLLELRDRLPENQRVKEIGY